MHLFSLVLNHVPHYKPVGLKPPYQQLTWSTGPQDAGSIRKPFSPFLSCYLFSSSELGTRNNKVTSHTIKMRRNFSFKCWVCSWRSRSNLQLPTWHPWGRVGEGGLFLLPPPNILTVIWRWISNSSLSRTPLNICLGFFQKEATNTKTNICPESALHDLKTT